MHAAEQEALLTAGVGIPRQKGQDIASGHFSAFQPCIGGVLHEFDQSLPLHPDMQTQVCPGLTDIDKPERSTGSFGLNLQRQAGLLADKRDRFLQKGAPQQRIAEKHSGFPHQDIADE